MTRHETISYRQIGELLSLSSTNILTLEKDKFLNSYFVLVSIYNLAHLRPLTPLFCCLNTIYTNCQIADTEVFILETVYPGGEGGMKCFSC